jgi:hypothetical protein
MQMARINGGTVGQPSWIRIGSGSNEWKVDIDNKGPVTAFPAPGWWLRVAPSARPPVTDSTYGWQGAGSLIVNGEFALDAPNEGGLMQDGTATAPNNCNLRVDRWRLCGTITGQSITTQRVVGGATNANGYYGYRSYLQVNSAASVTPSANQNALLFTNVEGGAWMGAALFEQVDPNQLDLEWCGYSSNITQPYDIVVMNAARSWSYVHRFTFNTQNGWQCFATAINQPPLSFQRAPIGQVGITVGFDLGAGVNYQTNQADTWLPGEFHEYAGDAQLVNGAFSIGGGSTIVSPGACAPDGRYTFTLLGGTSTAPAQVTGTVQSGLLTGTITIASNGAGSYTVTPANPVPLSNPACTTNPTINVPGWAKPVLALDAVHLYPVPFSRFYQPRDPATETWLAQRFFQKSYAYGNTVGTASGAPPGAATMISPIASQPTISSVNFSQAMVAPPLVTLYSTRANNATGVCTDATANVDVAGASALNIGTNGFALECPGVATPGHQLQSAWTADSGQ